VVTIDIHLLQNLESPQTLDLCAQVTKSILY